ncbi:MAG TPA: DUF3124 domain-containing protein [Deltaproteobacteria bacterium]|nr:DUF3124 domain-containing protein [Deltaproteobacteria bacterium]
MKRFTLFGILFLLALLSTTVFAKGPPKSKGQTIYAPAVHNDFSFYDENQNLVLRQIGITRLIIRNTDQSESITVTSVNFYSPDGTLAYVYVDEPLVLQPLESITFIAKPSVTKEPLWDSDDGRPSFIVKWESERKVSTPVIESGRFLMILVSGGQAWRSQAIDVTPGKVLREEGKSEGKGND